MNSNPVVQKQLLLHLLLKRWFLSFAIYSAASNIPTHLRHVMGNSPSQNPPKPTQDKASSPPKKEKGTIPAASPHEKKDHHLVLHRVSCLHETSSPEYGSFSTYMKEEGFAVFDLDNEQLYSNVIQGLYKVTDEFFEEAQVCIWYP